MLHSPLGFKLFLTTIHTLFVVKQEAQSQIGSIKEGVVPSSAADSVADARTILPQVPPCMGSYQEVLIESSVKLVEFLSGISPLLEVALDTEADSLHCYFEKLCLIQVSTDSATVLIDPLSGVELQLLFKGLLDKRVVFHGADYDLRLLARYGEFRPHEIFDTMVAARLLGYNQLGLAALVERFFGVKLSKASQKANWALRPLPRQMVEYAANDTKFLLPLAGILEAEIVRLGRQEWLRQSLERLFRSTKTHKEKDLSRAWRIAGSATLQPYAQAVLRELWNWREAEAREWNRPPFYVMSNEDMLKAAEAATRGVLSSPRFSPSRRKRFRQTLARALQIPEDCWPLQDKPARYFPSKQAVEEFGRLKRLRDEVAREEKLDPAIIAPRNILESIAFQKNLSGLMDWQKCLLQLG
ncbi:MAG: HRDC domain-containing protein [Candidatus Xiphinematobacter sp.]|nr:MAG: HRDC domain-containing protein [Candidatus Xiphinematobacter sp.]